MAVFEVQTVDPSTGVETWMPVSAATPTEALRLALDSGKVIGAVRLKSVHEPLPQPPAAHVPPVLPVMSATPTIVAGLGCVALIILALVVHLTYTNWVRVYSFEWDPPNNNVDDVTLWCSGSRGSDRVALVAAMGLSYRVGIMVGVIIPLALALGAMVCASVVFVRRHELNLARTRRR